MSTAPVQQIRQDKYSSEKVVSGQVTMVTMHGTLNEQFEGRKLATSIRTKKLLISMRDIRRFASWGMAEWMEFLRVTADCDLYIVECSTYAVSQLNLVTGLLGHAKLVSFYASYRCGSCSEEIQTLFLIPRDRREIRDIPNSTRECPTCNGRARLEEYPAAFFDTIAARPSFDIDDDALAYMRSQLNYDLSPDLTRFRAFRRVQKGSTYIRLTGNLATLPAEMLAKATENTTVLDLEHVVFDAAHMNAWRAYLQGAMPKAREIQLYNCPPGFIEAALYPVDFRDKLKVRTFSIMYDCGTCETTTTHVIDVAQHLEELVGGAVPQARCPSCRSALVASLTDDHIALVRALPARTRDVVLDAFLSRMRSEPNEKLENCLVAVKAATAAPSGRRSIYLAAGLGAVLVAALAVVSVKLWTSRSTTTPPPPVAGTDPALNPPTAERPAYTRPDWIIADVPASGYCHEMLTRMMCVGVSSYRVKRDEAVGEATDAALEELVNAVGLRISDPFFKDSVIPSYTDVRSKALSALQTAVIDRGSDPKATATYNAADEVVRVARKRVVESLQASGGAAVPVQRSDWYWEEYAATSGVGTEFLVFVRFDVSTDAMRALVEKYSSISTVGGISATTAFPELAWRRQSMTGGGAYLTKTASPLSNAGIAPQAIVVSVGAHRVSDASTFAHQLEDSLHAGGKLDLTVAGDTADSVVHVR